jgi:hypothetical protein
LSRNFNGGADQKVLKKIEKLDRGEVPLCCSRNIFEDKRQSQLPFSFVIEKIVTDAFVTAVFLVVLASS